MTKEQAIEVLHELDGSLYETQQAALDMAIKSLEQQPSDDCVSRQAVVEYIKTCDAELGHDSENEAVVEDILNMPPVTPIVKWIPVSEKLPEEGKEVLAYYEYFRYGDYNCMQTTYGVGYQYDGLWCGDIRGHKLNVIAWQPLPKPYEEKRGNENEVN